MVAQHKLDFDLLSDRDNAVARQFGLVFVLSAPLRTAYGKFGIDLAKFNGDDSWTLPIPASYVIDRGGTIRYADVDPDYTVRAEPEEILKALRAAAG